MGVFSKSFEQLTFYILKNRQNFVSNIVTVNRSSTFRLQYVDDRRNDEASGNFDITMVNDLNHGNLVNTDRRSVHYSLHTESDLADL